MTTQRQTPPGTFRLDGVPGAAAEPSLAQLAEVAKVRGLQVRTNAMQFAIAAAAGRTMSAGDLIAATRELVRYLEQG